MKKYICPMHPEVMSSKTGKCPKCGMKLVPEKTGNKKLAFSATLHCLTGCGIGDILGVIIGTALGLPYLLNILIGVILGFLMGYTLGIYPLVKNRLSFTEASKIVVTTETLSIAVMEAGEVVIELHFPGLKMAGLTHITYWLGLSTSLLVGFLVAYPFNLYLISKGRGHTTH